MWNLPKAAIAETGTNGSDGVYEPCENFAIRYAQRTDVKFSILTLHRSAKLQNGQFWTLALQANSDVARALRHVQLQGTKYFAFWKNP